MGVQRKRERLDADERRRRARSRLPAAQDHDERLVRRSSSGGQPVWRERRRGRRRDGRARLALPDGPPRTLGLRPAGRPQRAGRRGGRTSGEGARPGHEAGVRLRLRPGNRSADLADRGARGAAVRRSRRGRRRDAAVPHPPRPVRPAGHHRRRSHRLHTRATRRSRTDPRGLRLRADVHAAHGEERPAGRHAGHDPHARVGRRRELGWSGCRSRDGGTLRAVGHVAERYGARPTPDPGQLRPPLHPGPSSRGPPCPVASPSYGHRTDGSRRST